MNIYKQGQWQAAAASGKWQQAAATVSIRSDNVEERMQKKFSIGNWNGNQICCWWVREGEGRDVDSGGICGIIFNCLLPHGIGFVAVALFCYAFNLPKLPFAAWAGWRGAQQGSSSGSWRNHKATAVAEADTEAEEEPEAVAVAVADIRELQIRIGSEYELNTKCKWGTKWGAQNHKNQIESGPRDAATQWGKAQRERGVGTK